MHLCLVLGLDGHFAPADELDLHNVLLRHQTAKNPFRPLGRSTDLTDRLVSFLTEKGVPAEAASMRATDAIKILGAQSISEAFQTSNPWASLKGLASRPNTRFRWVHEDELKAHIAQQANKKHGAFVPRAKQKKQAPAGAKPLTAIDPSTLRLLPDTFVDDDGDEIAQIPFSEVGQDATGLAFCTFQEAKPFIEAADIISSTTLGLLINTEIPKDFWGTAALTHLCFPALCTVTDEPLLLHGTLLTLSDGLIRRKEHQSPQLEGNIQGQAWLIGSADPPPNKVMSGFDRDILITLQKEMATPPVHRSLVASNRTKRFLKEGQPAPMSSATTDPWLQGSNDPWSAWQKTTSIASSSASPPATRFSHLQSSIRDEIQKQVQQAPPGLSPANDIKRLEVNIAELQAQGTQFQHWFQEAGQRMNNTEAQLGQLRTVVEQQGQAVSAQIAEIQQEVDNKTQILQSTLQGSVAAMSNDLSCALETKLSSQFDRFEAMLAKKTRSE
eukprot:s622_g3.t1